MNSVNVKEMLDGVDEEQLSMIVSALQETATRYNSQGMILVAHKMRITAEKVLDIKKVRETMQAEEILGRLASRENKKSRLFVAGGKDGSKNLGTNSLPQLLGGGQAL